MRLSLSGYFRRWILFTIAIFPICVAAADTDVVDRIVAVVNEDLKLFLSYEQTCSTESSNGS
jgi:hypothetical protein